jgi:hypothetical protein
MAMIRNFAVGPALLLAVACGASPVGLDTLPVGTWGGESAGLLVRTDGAHAHIGCTVGDITGPIPLDSEGRFEVAGTWNVDAFPIDRGILHPARLSGRSDGRTLTLSVRLMDTGQVLGPALLVFGQEPRMQNCPICRR